MSKREGEGVGSQSKTFTFAAQCGAKRACWPAPAQEEEAQLWWRALITIISGIYHPCFSSVVNCGPLTGGGNKKLREFSSFQLTDKWCRCQQASYFLTAIISLDRNHDNGPEYNWSHFCAQSRYDISVSCRFSFQTLQTYLIFVIFLHEQNFWRIKFTLKNANILR